MIYVLIISSIFFSQIYAGLSQISAEKIRIKIKTPPSEWNNYKVFCVNQRLISENLREQFFVILLKFLIK
jgi:hypothetical protein